MSRRYPDWEIDGKDWPNRSASRFVKADGYDWHIQEMGDPDTPHCLLIHGTGSATHSWRDIIPLLAERYHVVAMDLPGHGFTRPNLARRVSLPQMAKSIALLIDRLEMAPSLIIGHSAGAAIGAQMLLDRKLKARLIGLNPALLPFPGLAARLFPTLAKVLFTNPFVSRIFARMARGPGEVERFLERSTGSKLDADGSEYYGRLLTRSGHCDGAIRMMASWRLEELERRLMDVRVPALLVHGQRDEAIPLSAVRQAAKMMPFSSFVEIAGVGHLAHEEAPEEILRIIAGFVAETEGKMGSDGGVLNG